MSAPTLFLTAIAAALTAGIRSFHNNYQQGTLIVDPYWVNFYITSYQDGFRRRALIGSVCRFFFPHGMSVIVINGLAMVAALACVTLLAYAFSRIVSATTYTARLWTFAFFASAFTGIFFEVLGDTLQMAFLIFCFSALFIARRTESSIVRMIVGLAALCIGFFIHEASIFLLAPCLPFFLRRRPVLYDFVAPFILFLGLFALSVHWSQVAVHLTNHAILYPHGGELAQVPETPGFKALLQDEYHNDFTSIYRFLALIGRLARVVLLGVAGLIALSKCLSKPVLALTLKPFLCVMLFSIPLWLVAHDWGRFLCYSLFLAIVSTLVWHDQEVGVETVESSQFGMKLANLLLRVGDPELIGFAILFVLLDSPFRLNRVEGMNIPDFLGFFAVVALGVVGFMVRLRQPQQRFSGEAT